MKASLSTSGRTPRVLLCALLCLCLRTSALAEEPLCGIRSVYTASLLLGRDAPFSDVLKPEFVGSEAGSSLAELEKAAASIGLHSLSVTRLTTHDLRWSELPIILHVRTDLAKAQYNHFVLFAGMIEGKARIFDGPEGMRLWTPAEVASRWDGNALVLSTDPIDLGALTAPSRRNLIYWAVAIGGVVALMLAAQKRTEIVGQGRFRTCVKQMALLLLVAGCGAWVYHGTAPAGFLAGPEAVRAVRAANASTFLPTIDLDAARALHAQGRAVFVDARSPDDFRAGHIEGSVNLPAYLAEAEARRLAGALPRGRRIVVYCANAKCPFSHTTAQRLLEAGHDDVVIFTDGWKAWTR